MNERKEGLLKYIKSRIINDDSKKIKNNEFKSEDVIKILDFIIKAKKFSDLYKTGFLSDITIYFNEKPYYLHKKFLEKSGLLKMVCEYSENKKLDESNKIKINVKEDILDYMLKYLYDGEDYLDWCYSPQTTNKNSKCIF